MLGGLSNLFIEWTSICDKTHLCGMCGHQNEAINTSLKHGEMSLELMEKIRRQLPTGIALAFHKDGDPLAHSRVGDALAIFKGFVTAIVTHGLNLAKKADEIIDNCTTVNVSIFRGDRDHRAQFESLKAFMEKKGNRAPMVQAKVIGDMDNDSIDEYVALGVAITRRLLHVPIDNSRYVHRDPVVPETRVCSDALHRPSIDWEGNFWLCNRLNPERHGYLGNVKTDPIELLWNGPTRQRMIEAHKAGRRDLANPLCATCKHWGTPSQ
jgi:hypothetical protein